MKADPVLKELWQIKDRLAAECGHDLRRLFDLLKQSQANRVTNLVNRTTRHMRVAEPDSPGYGSHTHRT